MFGLDVVFKKVFGTATDRYIKRLQPTVAAIGALEPKMQGLSDAQLAALTPSLRQKLDNGATLDDVLPEAFAAVREAGRRTMGMRHYDVQLIGGMVLHQGKIAEMKTGEGKTLVATSPVYLNALSGKGVHIVTVNDYLAKRDAEWMGRIYKALGMSVGTILSSERDDAVKRAAYAADITYGTNNEFGFDYLRDNMKFRAEEYTQRGHNFAIVDEVDSILIDEARTPLIISGPTNDPVDTYYTIDNLVPLLQNEIDYVVDEKNRQVHLTDQGIDKIEHKIGIKNLFDPRHMETLHHVNQALRAHTIYRRDVDYVVGPDPHKGGEIKVIIIDSNTGRKMYGRRWSDGLHQAIEAKEKLPVEQESQTYATITFQNYFRMYSKLGGMTGTAETEAPEFAKIYNLEVVVIPTNKPVQRRDEDDTVYRFPEEKFEMVLKDIRECNERGQPVLVGTTSVEKSEQVARMLQRAGIPHNVLNAKEHSREGHIVAQAGRSGAVTISTNMAGRGTDIKLGGNAEELAKDEIDPVSQPEAYAARVKELEAICEEDKRKVLAAGGLRIIGTERHESRRIDNQLRGRSGRQGDPGSSKFYLSLEDDLLKLFGTDRMAAFMEKMGIQDREPVTHPWITNSIENAQKKVEGHNFNIRKNLLEYDDVLNQQRKLVYELRRKALLGENVRDIVVDALESVVEDVMDDTVRGKGNPEDWDIAGLKERVVKLTGVAWEEPEDKLRDLAQEELRNRLHADLMARYETKEKEFGAEAARQVERMLLLQFTDQFWKDHLLAMDRLRDGIGLRGYGQRNPLLEYKKEGFNMFMMMTALRDEAVVARLLRLQMAPTQSVEASKAAARRLAGGLDAIIQRPAAPQPQAPAEPESEGGPGVMPYVLDPAQEEAARRAASLEAESAPQTVSRPQPGAEARAFARAYQLRKNDPCPCGSGKKFKKCCYDPADMPAEEEGAGDGAAPETQAATPPAAPEPELAAPAAVSDSADASTDERPIG